MRSRRGRRNSGKLRARATLVNSHPRTNPPLRKTARALSRLGSGPDALRAEIILIDDSTMAGLAGRFRKSPYPTDVLAFPYDDDPGLDGEVVISLDTARRQAAERRVGLAEELALLCVHGLLHLAGQDDETKRGWRETRVREFETLMRIL